jgi:hypothetical protein
MPEPTLGSMNEKFTDKQNQFMPDKITDRNMARKGRGLFDAASSPLDGLTTSSLDNGPDIDTGAHEAEQRLGQG